MSYQVNQVIRLTNTITVGGTATDPGALTFEAVNPAGSVTVYQYGTDAALVKGTVGVYYVDYLAALAGHYTYRFQNPSTGAARGAVEAGFYVEPSVFG